MFTNIHTIIITKIVNLKSHVIQMPIRQNHHSSFCSFGCLKLHLCIYICFWVPYFVCFHETKSFGDICVSIGSLHQKILILRVFYLSLPDSFDYLLSPLLIQIFTFGYTISTKSFFCILPKNIKFLLFVQFINIIFISLLYYTRRIEWSNNSISSCKWVHELLYRTFPSSIFLQVYTVKKQITTSLHLLLKFLH